MDSSIKYSYNIFISYNHFDREWVETKLMVPLELVGLVVCPLDPEPGLIKIANIEEAITKSEHILLIITPEWLQDQWNAYEKSITLTLYPIAKKRVIIPLVLRPCKLPLHLDQFTAIDLTTPDKWAAGIERLIQTLTAPNQATEIIKLYPPSQALSPKFVPRSLTRPEAPPTDQNFAGRQEIIQRLLFASQTYRIISVLGIPGIGKTALMKQIAAQLETDKVFWYEFLPGLFSLDDILIQLARFLVSQSEASRYLVDEVQAATTSELDKLSLLINRLNDDTYFLFFDAVQHVEERSAVESLFVLLKNRLSHGAIFLASREQPTFYTRIDEAKRIVYTIRLDGLTVEETSDFFDRHNTTLRPEMIASIQHHLGGLPLALDLVAALLAEQFDESQLMDLIDNTQEEIVKILFSEVYEQITATEKALLALASLFHWPFPQDQLFKIYGFVHSQPGSRSDLEKLQRRFLIQPLGKGAFQIHEMIRELALAYDDSLPDNRVTVAGYLERELSDIYEAQLEAIMLYWEAKAFDQAAALTVSMVDSTFIPYHPRLAETLLNGFKEEKISQAQWMWLAGSKGNLAHFWRKFEQAREQYHVMLTRAQAQPDEDAIAVAFQRLGILYSESDTELAEQYYLDSLAIKKELKDLSGQAQIYNNLGSLYIRQARYVDAHEVLGQGLALREQINSPEWQKLHLYGNMGQLHAEQAHWEEATQYHEQTLTIAKTIGDSYQIALTTYNLGIDADRQGNNELALTRFNEALQIAQTQRLWSVEELIQIALGKLHDELKNHDQAIQYFQEVAKIQSEIDDKARLATTYFDIGTFYWHKGELQQAVDYYSKGIEIFEHLAPKHEKVNLFLGNIRNLASQTSATRPLVEALKQLKNRLLEQTPSYALARVYVTLGEIYLDHLHLDRVGFACVKQAAVLYNELEQWEEQIQELTYLGVKYEEREQFANAIDILTQATEVAQNHSLVGLLAIAFYDRANCYAILEMWPQAERDYQTALQTAIEISDDKLQDAIQHNVGESYRRKGEIKAAIPLLQKCLEFAQRHNNIDDQLRTLNNLGLAYAALLHRKTALEHFKTALALARQHYRKQDEATVLISLGNFYMEDEQPDQAKSYYEQAHKIALLTENIALEEDCMISLAYAQRQLGTFEQLEAEFKRVAERAGTVKHYERLIQFLILAGRINLVDEKDPETAATSFEQALTVSLTMTAQRIMQFDKHTERPELAPEIGIVFRDICLAINDVLQKENWSLAREFYETLFERLQGREIFGEVLIQYLSPIRSYLDERPQQPFVDYLSAVWSQFSNNIE